MAVAGLYRELRADGLRHGRVVRRARSRSTRFRICEAISASDPTGRCREHRRRVRTDRRRGRERAGSFGQLALPRRSGHRAGVRRDHPPRGGSGMGPRDGAVSPARLGSVAPALLGHADPDHPLRGVRGRSRPARPAAGRAARGRRFRDARQSARPSPDLEARRLPKLRSRSDARNRHARHLRRFRAGISSASRASPPTSPSIAPRRRSGFRSRNISAG